MPLVCIFKIGFRHFLKIFLVDLSDYYESGEWDLLAVPATRSDRYYHCCPEPYTDLTFLIKIRRKTLFHTVNMLFPCVIMAILSIFTFYLPADTRQKINMGISILVSLTVFVLLLNEVIFPPRERKKKIQTTFMSLITPDYTTNKSCNSSDGKVPTVYFDFINSFNHIISCGAKQLVYLFIYIFKLYLYFQSITSHPSFA